MKRDTRSLDYSSYVQEHTYLIKGDFSLRFRSSAFFLRVYVHKIRYSRIGLLCLCDCHHIMGRVSLLNMRTNKPKFAHPYTSRI